MLIAMLLCHILPRLFSQWEQQGGNIVRPNSTMETNGDFVYRLDEL